MYLYAERSLASAVKCFVHISHYQHLGQTFILEDTSKHQVKAKQRFLILSFFCEAWLTSAYASCE